MRTIGTRKTIPAGVFFPAKTSAGIGVRFTMLHGKSFRYFEDKIDPAPLCRSSYERCEEDEGSRGSVLESFQRALFGPKKAKRSAREERGEYSAPDVRSRSWQRKGGVPTRGQRVGRICLGGWKRGGLGYMQIKRREEGVNSRAAEHNKAEKRKARSLESP